LVESALSATLFFTLLFGIVGWSMVIWAYVYTGHAAREASRWASMRGSKSGVTTVQQDVVDFVKGTPAKPAPTLGLNPANITVSATWSPANENPGGTVTVTVSCAIPRGIPFIPTVNVSSTSVMTIVQ
jgi:hypothetical protein